MAGLAEFLDCVVEVDADLTASEIADAFWLAEKMEALQSAATAVATGLAAAAPTGPLGPAESGTASGPAAKEPQPAEGLPPPAAPAAGGGSGGPTKSGEPIPVFHDDPAGAADLVAAGLPTVPLALAMPRELRRPLNLQRGLRPLMRTVRSGPATVLDEGATAVLSARALAVMPALVAAGERWLDLALVIDTSPSMALWGSLVRELRVALSQFGAFRAVRTWRLAFDGGKPLVRTEAAWSTARAPRELIDPTGRQVVLVLTDCIAQPWWPKSGPNGGMLMDETLEAWAGTGPLAILQPLPQRMWARCGMAGHSTRLRSPFPGAPNSSLLTDRAATRWAGQRAADFGRTRRGVPIPVLEIDQRWLASWSRLISSTSPERVAVAFTGAPRPDYDPGGPERPSPQLDEEDQARWLVRQFRSVASPEAFRLAGLLAAAPLTLPLMRLIQRVLCTDDRQVPLAEVLLGGLLRDVTPAGEPMASFAFLPHVRDMLLDTIRRSEAIRVRELVAEELSRGRGAGRSGYVARIPVVPGTTGTALTTTRDIWIAIDAKVLSRIGGRYAQVVLGTGQDALAARTQAPAEPEVLVPPPAREQATRQETATEKTSGLLDAAGRREAPVPDGDMQGLVMLGGPGSGKTTYLAALSIALIRGPGWRLIPRDDLSTEMLTDGVLDLIRRRVFPRATDEITNYHWKLAGEIDRGWRPGSGRRLETVSLDLRVTEATGEIFTRHQPGRRASLIEELVRSAGIIFLFDPTREFEVGDTIDYVLQVVALLRRRALSEGALADDRLKQYVAVCMSKFDDHHVFRSAERMGLVSYSSRDPYGFPRVADASARRFLQELCRLAPSETAELAISTLEKSFLPARIRYFVTSAIGFHLDRRTRKFNREDPSNYQDYLLDDGSGAKRVRGSVYPINVAEPLVWLNEQLAKPSS